MFTKGYIADLLLYNSNSVAIIPVTQINSNRYWLLQRYDSTIDSFYETGSIRDTLNGIYDISPGLEEVVSNSLRLYPEKIIVWVNDSYDYVIFIPIPPLRRMGVNLIWCSSKDILTSQEIKISVRLRSFLENM
jgi:hypothetical protein